jgi:penicillin-binding protein 1C
MESRHLSMNTTLHAALRLFFLPALRLAWLVAVAMLALLAALSLLFPLRVDVPYSQLILAADGSVIHSFLSTDDKWRMKTELHEISPTLRRAILEKEDRWFLWHCGVNPASVLRAAVGNLTQQKITSGASTITMQVARMLENLAESRAVSSASPQNNSKREKGEKVRARSLWNKLVECFRALQLEARYSKEEILQLYVNLAPFGGNIEGMKAASLLYFGQSPERLSLAQAVTLTIIPNRPTSLSLRKMDEGGVSGTGGSSEASSELATARNLWLWRFAADGVFAAQETEDALHEPLGLSRRAAPMLVPQFALRLRLRASEGSRTDAAIIRSTLDMTQQSAVQTLMTNKMRRLAMRGIFNAAVLVVDNRTHEVRAYVGSPDFTDKTHFGEVDGVKAVRSPGSALKPLVYGLAMDKGYITPKSILTDVPVNFDGYAPENFDRRYLGAVSAERALVLSLNVPAVKLADKLGTLAIVERLKQAGFEQIRADERKLGLSLVLGGCGVRLEEMVGLYSAFANSGVYSPLRWQAAEAQPTQPTQPSTAQILSPAAAFMLSEILTQLTRPDVPNRYVSFTRLPKVAWKTGTSYGRRDAWSVGYNKRYTVGVWVGNVSGAGVPELVGAEVATPLLFEVFNTIDYNSPNDWFAPPASGLDFRLVCSQSGLPPSDFCTDQVTDYYIPAVSQTQRCQHLKRVFVSLDGQYSYNPDCLPPAGNYQTKLYPNVPPELVALYTKENYDFERIPELHPDCKRLSAASGAAPAITSLVNGKEYLLERAPNGVLAGQLMLTCATMNDVREVYWYINEKFFRAAKPHERLFFTPERGEVKISCSDDKGRITTIWIHAERQ